MKQIKLLMLVAILPLLANAQQEYTITGQVGKLDKPAKAYLLLKQGNQDILDSVYLDKGKFKFVGTIPSPMEAHVRIKHDDTPDDPTKKIVFDAKAFLIEGAHIELIAKDSIKHAVITGSPLNDENEKVTLLLKPIYDKYDILNKEYNSKSEADKQDPKYIQTLEDRAAKIDQEVFDTKMDYIRKHPDNYMALMALNSLLKPDFDAIEMEKVFASLSQPVRQSILAKDVDIRIQTFKKTQEGVEAIDFTQPDVNGVPVKLSDYRGKYVLIDFWASWCAPCRRENPHLVKTYERFKSKGFEILGISLDKASDKQRWLNAIEKDKLTWKQVSDLKGWDNEAARLYEVTAIPMNFLIDPQGKIIAKYLRNDDLDNKLISIFGE